MTMPDAICANCKHCRQPKRTFIAAQIAAATEKSQMTIAAVAIGTAIFLIVVLI